MTESHLSESCCTGNKYCTVVQYSICCGGHKRSNFLRNIEIHYHKFNAEIKWIVFIMKPPLSSIQAIATTACLAVLSPDRITPHAVFLWVSIWYKLSETSIGRKTKRWKRERESEREREREIRSSARRRARLRDIGCCFLLVVSRSKKIGK